MDASILAERLYEIGREYTTMQGIEIEDQFGNKITGVVDRISKEGKIILKVENNNKDCPEVKTMNLFNEKGIQSNMIILDVVCEFICHLELSDSSVKEGDVISVEIEEKTFYFITGGHKMLRPKEGVIFAFNYGKAKYFSLVESEQQKIKGLTFSKITDNILLERLHKESLYI